MQGGPSSTSHSRPNLAGSDSTEGKGGERENGRGEREHNGVWAGVIKDLKTEGIFNITDKMRANIEVSENRESATTLLEINLWYIRTCA